MLDHQSGLFQVVKDIDVAQLRASTAVLAKLGSWMKLVGRNMNRLRFTRLAGLFQKLGHCGEWAVNFWVDRDVSRTRVEYKHATGGRERHS
jgi:hypothetical protein